MMSPTNGGETDNAKHKLAASPLRASRDMPSGLYDHPGHLLRRAQQVVVASFYQNLGRDTLTPLQYALMVAISENPGIDQVSLAQLVALDNSTAAETAVRLEKKGFIRRELHIVKRRQRKLFLTEQGGAALGQMEAGIEQMKSQLLDRLPASKQALFMGLLRSFIGADVVLESPSSNVRSARALPQAALAAPKPRRSRNKEQK